jgi:hypothetical protein
VWAGETVIELGQVQAIQVQGIALEDLYLRAIAVGNLHLPGDLFAGDIHILGIQLQTQSAAPTPNTRHQRGSRSHHGVQDGHARLGEEFDEFLRQRFRELGRVGQHVLAARRRVMDEPALLELQPLLRLQGVQFIGFHKTGQGPGNQATTCKITKFKVKKRSFQEERDLDRLGG